MDLHINCKIVNKFQGTDIQCAFSTTCQFSLALVGHTNNNKVEAGIL
jgi:hypothetical protein